MPSLTIATKSCCFGRSLKFSLRGEIMEVSSVSQSIWFAITIHPWPTLAAIYSAFVICLVADRSRCQRERKSFYSPIFSLLMLLVFIIGFAFRDENNSSLSLGEYLNELTRSLVFMFFLCPGLFLFLYIGIRKVFGYGIQSDEIKSLALLGFITWTWTAALLSAR